MAIEKNNVVSKMKLGTEQINTECNIVLDETASKILSYTVYPMIENIEVNSGEVNVAGKLSIKLIYLSAENQIVCKEQVCDFNSKYLNSAIEPTYKIDVKVKLVDTNASMLNETSIKISSILELCYIALIQEENPLTEECLCVIITK